MKKRSLKQGFTLIELMIVITVIMVLTIVAMTSFTAVERQTRVSFAADTLVSVWREAQTLAKSGQVVDDGSGTKTLFCRAVKIVGSGADAGIYTSQSKYIGLPPANPDGTPGAGPVDTCAGVPDSGWQKNTALDGRITVINAEADGGSGGVGDTFEFYFKPPFGQILANDGSGVLAKPTAEKVTVTIGSIDQPSDQQKVEIDLVTGVVKRI